jgi:hypothetical protein
MAAVGGVCDSFADFSNIPAASTIVGVVPELILVRLPPVAFSYWQS